MFACFSWNPEQRPDLSLTRGYLGGAPVYRLEVCGAPRRVKRRVKRSVAELAKRGVRRFVADGDWPESWHGGLRRIDDRQLRRALLPQLLTAVCRAQSLPLPRAAVLLSAPSPSPEVWQAAELLARRSRYLLLELPDSAALQDMLRRRYGLSALTRQDRAPLLQVCFGEPSLPVPALLLGEDSFQRQKVEYAVSPDWQARLSPSAVTPPLLAALWESGALPAEEIRVASIASNA